MIFETKTDPFLWGHINAWGDVDARIAYDDQAQHPHEWRAYKTWRFIPDIGLLMWWEPPDEGEKMTVEDWLDRKGYEVKLRSVMGNKLRVSEVIKSLKGTPIKRFKNNVGKQVGPQLYVHRKYAAEVIPNDKLKYAAEVLKQIKPNFHFNSIMWNSDTGEIRFDEAPDFDTAREPHVGKYITVRQDGTTREGQSNNIWHHKWLWVKDDYQGFDVDKSKEWSTMWLSKLPQVAKGTDKAFGSQLQQHGLAETEKMNDMYVYSVTTANRLDSIANQGLRIGSKRSIGASSLDTHAKGKLFFTDKNGLSFWLTRAEQFIEHNYDNYAEEGIVPVILRIPKTELSLTPDPLGTKDAGHPAYFTAEDVNPRYIEVWDGKTWNDVYQGVDASLGVDVDGYLRSDSPLRTIREQTGQINMKELLMTEASKDEAALDYLKHMVRNGPWRGQVYLAGGAVRDMVMGKTPKDLDLVVTNHGKDGGMEFARWLAQQMGNFKEVSNPVLFPTFGTAKVVLAGKHNGVDLDGFDVEVVFARKEVYTPGSRKPQVSSGTIEDDAYRRDFTVNSMMMDLTTGQILDITGKGKSDIKAGIIRTTSDPDEIFGQDALRMFRAVRFATKYNWQIDPATIEGIKNNLNNLSNTSKERVRDELDKILQTTNPRKGFELMRDLGLLSHLAPELQQAVGMTQNVHHKEDVFGHTMSVLNATKPELVTRLMALFHDIGKIATRSETPTGVHFYDHENVGAEVAEKIMRDLKYPYELIAAVKAGVKNHMRLKSGGDAAELSDKTLRKFKIALGDNLEQVLDLIHADNTAHADASAMPNQIEKIRQRLKVLDIQVKKPTLPINGEDLKAIGVPQGKQIGQILSVITDKWFENPNITREEALSIAQSIML